MNFGGSAALPPKFIPQISNAKFYGDKPLLTQSPAREVGLKWRCQIRVTLSDETATDET
jgi:hypothetical protein